MISVNGVANGWAGGAPSQGRSIADRIEILRSKIVSDWRYEARSGSPWAGGTSPSQAVPDAGFAFEDVRGVYAGKEAVAMARVKYGVHIESYGREDNMESSSVACR
jgi:hypothetical protein